MGTVTGRRGNIKSDTGALDRLPSAVRRQIVEQSLRLYKDDRAAFDLVAEFVAHLRPRRRYV